MENNENLKLPEDLRELPDWDFDQWCGVVDSSLKSGRPNVRPRSGKTITDEFEKFKAKKC